MSFPKNSFFLLLFWCRIIPTTAQNEIIIDEKISDEIEQLIESYSEETDAVFSYDTYIEQLNDIARRPFNLNTIRYEELLSLRPLITPEEAAAIIAHGERFGNFISIYELNAVEGLDLATAERIKIFFTVDEYQKIPVRKILRDGNFEIYLRWSQILEEQKGFSSAESGQSRYSGNPSRIYTRFRYSFPGKISYGFTVEKDAGEELFKNSRKSGFDFYSGHLFLEDVGVFKNIALGDYEVKIGQGLVMWSGFGFGKSYFVTNVKKSADVLKPYTSVDENNFLRGAAATAVAGNFEITGFLSRDKKDANIAEADTTGEENFISEATSILESGLHRTDSELSDKDALKQTVAGGYLKFRKNFFHAGVSAVHTRLNLPLQRSFQPYNQFQFSGKSISNFGADYSFTIRNFYFFGEAAISDKPAFATVHGVIASLDPAVGLSLVYRHYQREYFSFYSNSFGENSDASNEQGVYAGISVKPVQKFQLDAYADFFRFPWLRYQADVPSSGTDFFTQLTWRPSKKIEMYGRYKNETKGKNQPDNSSKIDNVIDANKQNARFNIKYKISQSITFENRFEYTRYDDGVKENGYLIFHDIDFRPLSFPLSFSARFALFDTDSYDTRLYAYENDVLYHFSIPSYFYRGTRFYFLVRYKVFRQMDVWVKFAQTYYSNRDVIGSGLDEIQGSKKTEIRAQMRLRF